MRDPATFEARLADAYARYTDAVETEIDAYEIAASAIAASAPRGPRASLRRLGRSAEAVRLLLIAALLVLLALAVVAVGSRQRLPPPFGLAGNGLIAYSAGGDIYVGDPITGESRLIYTTPEEEFEPVWSPDGTRIVINQLVRDGQGVDIVVMDADGSDPVRVNPEPLLSEVTWVDWSPDGRSIVIVAQGRFFLADAGGSGMRTIVEDLSVDVPVYRPPDGSEILFRGATGSVIGLHVINPDGSHRRGLVPPSTSSNPEFDLREPRYSADGTRVAYQRWSGDGRMRLYVMDADGSAPIPVGDEPEAWFEGWPVWSPDGTRIAFVRMFLDANGQMSEMGGRFAVVLADGTGPVIDVGPPMGPRGGRIEWSPDGTKLLMNVNEQDDPDARQLILDPNGGPAQQVPWDSNSYPSWQRVVP